MSAPNEREACRTIPSRHSNRPEGRLRRHRLGPRLSRFGAVTRKHDSSTTVYSIRLVSQALPDEGTQAVKPESPRHPLRIKLLQITSNTHLACVAIASII